RGPSAAKPQLKESGFRRQEIKETISGKNSESENAEFRRSILERYQGQMVRHCPWAGRPSGTDDEGRSRLDGLNDVHPALAEQSALPRNRQRIYFRILEKFTGSKKLLAAKQYAEGLCHGSDLLD